MVRFVVARSAVAGPAVALLALLAAGCVAAPRGPATAPSTEADLAARLDSGPTVRVAVAPRAAGVVVEGTSLVATDLARGRGALVGRPGPARLEISAAGPDVAVDGRASGTSALALDGAGLLALSLPGEPVRQLRGRVQVTARDGALLVVNEVPLERYLAGVVSVEMDPKSWPIEALKAQAVASRTYARQRVDARRRAGGAFAHYDLESTVLDQVYAGAQAEHARAREAVAATAGEWMAGPDGQPILAAFHSTAGGMTEASEDVWGAPRPYLVAQRCPYDRGSPVFDWRLAMPVAEVERRLLEAGVPANGLERLEVAARTGTGRAATIRVQAEPGAAVVRATALRETLGWGRLKSTAFTVAREGNVFLFEGRGSGHGVGMCQWGARGMALAGHDYRQILDYYYPGVRLIAP